MRAERRLAALAGAGLNFTLLPPEDYTPENGWHADAVSQPLPRGSWEIARRLTEEYAMADPALVRATWDPAAPLLGRELLLELRLYRLLSVHAGVRVTRVWDETRDGERVFGFEYATLTGHVEMGRMDYEVCRRLDDGAVDFRLHAHSRPSGDGPLWVRLGFRLFGRREQLRFYARCCDRMARLTARELGLPEAPPPPAVRLQPRRPRRWRARARWPSGRRRGPCGHARRRARP
jgi:uncharacterized protein (UPF0548 family)